MNEYKHTQRLIFFCTDIRSGGSGLELVGVATSTNAAYKLTNHVDTEKEEECEYASVSQRCSPVVSPLLTSDEKKGEDHGIFTHIPK